MPKGKILDPNPPSKINAAFLTETEFPHVRVDDPINDCPVYYGVIEHHRKRYLYFDDKQRKIDEDVDFDFAVFSVGYRIAVNLRNPGSSS